VVATVVEVPVKTVVVKAARLVVDKTVAETG